MEVDRDRRWPTAAGLAVELDRLAAEYERRGQATVRSRRRIGLLSTLTVLALVVLGGAGYAWYDHDRSAGSGGAASAAFTTLQDAERKITVQVPSAWAKQDIGSGWSPAALGLSGAEEPGLLVATDAQRGWTSLTTPVDGVFVGLTTDDGVTDVVEKRSHGGDCHYAGSTTYKGAAWSGPILEWTDCPGTTGALYEAALTPARAGDPYVYLQVRQDGGASQVRAIIDRLQVTS
jgi:hypothetical protein